MPRRRSNRAPDTAEAAARADNVRRSRDIEMAFLEALRVRLPNHAAVVESLGALYTEAGRHADGLEADRTLVGLEPHSALAWYNLACSLSLTGQPDQAFDALEKAAALGYADAEWMQSDEDLAPIRQDPRFARLLARLDTETG